MVQFVLLYSAHYESFHPIDLSQLAFGDSTESKYMYFTGLTLSIVSVSFTCTVMLKWGHRPVIKSFYSFKFLKILLFILTKFFVQAYILSMALKNLMYFEVFLPNANRSSLAFQIFNYNYYGLCKKRYF